MNYMILSTILYALIFVLVFYSVINEKEELVKGKDSKKLTIGFGIALGVIFIVQLCSATLSQGYPNDFGLFKLWTSFGNEHKFSEYYTTEGVYVDYPPVYLYVLFFVGKIAKLFGVSPDATGYMCFMKAPAILCDAFTSILIFWFAKDKIGEKKAIALALISAMNPVNIINSTVWGQVDSFSTLTIIGILLCLYNRKYVWASVMMGLSFMTKPQNIIFAPVFGLTFLFDLYEYYQLDQKKFKEFLLTIINSIVAFIATLLIISIPITGGDLSLIVERYAHAVGLYPYTTLNAANIYGAIGANAQPDAGRILFLSFKQWGFVFIACMIGFLIYLFVKSKSRNKIIYGGAFTVATIYLFAHNMHERYLYPLMLILMVLFIMEGDKKLLWLYFGFSLTHFWNVGMVLNLAISQPKNPYFSSTDPFFIILSWLQLIMFGIFVVIGYRNYIKLKDPLKAERKMNEKPQQEKQGLFKITRLQDEQEKVKTTRVDIIIIAALMLVYSLFAFYKLGSLNTPQTGWYPQSNNESVVLTFDKVEDIKQFYIQYGWMDRRRSDQDVKRVITIQTSQDGMHWNEEQTVTIADVFEFKHFKIDETAKYLQLSIDEGRVYINEVAFYGDTEESRIYPVSVQSPTGNDTAQLIIDEPDKMVYRYSWFDEAYFDEIYHPRTAYENLTNRYPFENTHPPLGKLIIAGGMSLFGVTPFGWRFFGTLAGVLMIPLAYMLGKKMFKKSLFGFITALLFTFDFMHLSQTRLATIDSFTTLFVMGMFYYMYQYYTKSFYNVGVKKTLYPLFMSGLFFGVGIATKWQGAYAGAGLAILFFMSLGRRYLEYRYAKKETNRDERLESVVRNFKKQAVQTLLFACLFFVVIPGIIYFLSYIPAMNTPETGLKFFFENQSSMYNYHSTLNATHPYGSQWWSWPLDIRPLYSYTAPADFLPEGMSMGMASFGNPLVWWPIIPAIVYAIYCCVKRKGSKELTVLLVGFAALYCPWMVVTRVCFIYHFFPAVIFGVLAIVYAIKRLLEQNKIKLWMVLVYLGLVVILFCAFYPVLTGMMIPRVYMENFLKWFPTWVFG